MTIRVQQLHPLFFGKVEGVDLRQPVDPATFAEIEAAIDRHAVLVFPDQQIDDLQQIAFSGRFGPLEGAAKTILKGTRPRLERSEIADASTAWATSCGTPTRRSAACRRAFRCCPRA